MTASPLMIDGLKMIAVLVFVLVGLVLLNFYVRRHLHTGGGHRGRRIRVLENAHLGVKKNLALVQVPGAVLVLGVTAERISLLERIADPDGIQAAASSREEAAPAGSFKDHLQRLTSTFEGTPSDGRQGESA